MNYSNNHNLGVGKYIFLTVFFLCIINLIIYFPSIGGYFLADDFIHINYLSEVFNKDPLLLFNNFHTNWMQAVGTKFYRPLITLTLAFDYLFWGNNSVGFHLSNIVFQISCTLLVYFLTYKMNVLAIKEEKSARSIGTLTAILFAAYPLHPEVVSWMIGRVDSVSTMFYLGAFLLFLYYIKSKKESTKIQSIKLIYLISSLFLYFCALLSKEVAIPLPLAIWLWSFTFDCENKSLLSKFIFSTKLTLPYWIMLCIFLAIRTLSLGTFFGGYDGSIGAALSFSLLNRFTEISSLNKLLLPFNNELFSPHHWLRIVLVASYTLATLFFIIRLLNKNIYLIPNKLMIYTALWLITCFLPIYQVFDLGPDLQGSRLVYLASVPLCLLLSLLLTPLIRHSVAPKIFALDLSEKKQLLLKLTNMAFFSICLPIALIFVCVTYINNIPWRQAGDELRQLQKALIQENIDSGPNKKLALMNIPDTYNGAHMLYNGLTLNLLCSSALTGKKASFPIVTFEPILYGDADLLNYARFNRLLNNKEQYVFLGWQRNLLLNKKTKDKKNFLNQLFPRSNYGNLKKLVFNHTDSNEIPQIDYSNSEYSEYKKFKIVKFSNLNLSTIYPHLIEFSIKAAPKPANKKVAIAWLQLEWFSQNSEAITNHGSLTKPLTIDGKTHKYIFNVSERKSWLLCNKINQIKIIAPPGGYNLQIESVKFLNPDKLIPQFGSDYREGPHEDDAGFYILAHNQGFLFEYNTSQIKNTKSVYYEISKPNYWFEHNEDTFTNTQFSKNALIKRQLASNKGKFTISGSDLETGFFEIHIAAVDGKNNILGLTSYPVCGQVGNP